MNMGITSVIQFDSHSAHTHSHGVHCIWVHAFITMCAKASFKLLLLTGKGLDTAQPKYRRDYIHTHTHTQYTCKLTHTQAIFLQVLKKNATIAANVCKNNTNNNGQGLASVNAAAAALLLLLLLLLKLTVQKPPIKGKAKPNATHKRKLNEDFYFRFLCTQLCDYFTLC